MKFQFHKGTIKTNILRIKIEDKCNFNSIKVQLRRGLGGKPTEPAEFQFHKGTIKTLD